MKKFLLLIAVTFLVLHYVNSQTFVDEDFEQTGKFIFKVFANFHADVSNDEISNTAFEVRRAYLGYGHDFTKKLTAQVILDVGLDDQNRYGAYLKIAGLTWRVTDKFTINGGMISPKQFKTQERFWGYRYLYKSYMDEYKFGYSADLGMTAEYKFNKYVSADLGFFNGEGYKNVQLEYGDFRGTAGVTVKPIEALELRAYGDIMNNNDTTLNDSLRQNQSTLALYIGARITKKFRIAGEYNYQRNFKHVDKHDLYGYSFYAIYAFSEKFEIFTRADILLSNKVADEPETWNYKKDGIGILGGIQYTPVKGLKLALNGRHVEPKQPAEEPTPLSKTWIYFNVEFKWN